MAVRLPAALLQRLRRTRRNVGMQLTGAHVQEIVLKRLSYPSQWISQRLRVGMGGGRTQEKGDLNRNRITECPEA